MRLANLRIPLTRDEIATALDVTADPEHAIDASDRAIDVLVGRLRSKIEKSPEDAQLLRTERRIGYVFAAVVTSEDA